MSGDAGDWRRRYHSLTCTAAADGAAVALLGMFEQGFYDRFGFATGAPMLVARSTPPRCASTTAVSVTRRLGLADGAAMGDAMRRRLPHHGRVTSTPRTHGRGMGIPRQPFALGYRDGDRITHFVAGSLKEENGPFEIQFCSYETGDSCSNCSAAARTRRPGALGGDDGTAAPAAPSADRRANRQRSRSRRGAHEPAPGSDLVAARVLDVPAVVSARQWVGPPVEFDLVLTTRRGDAAGRHRRRGVDRHCRSLPHSDRAIRPASASPRRAPTIGRCCAARSARSVDSGSASSRRRRSRSRRTSTLPARCSTSSTPAAPPPTQPGQFF